MFNDTFTLYKKASGSGTTRTKIEIDEKGIAWASDLQYKFKNLDKGIPATANG
jgi:hypothetical protein